MERPYTQSDPIPTFQRAKETALFVLGDFWLLLVDLFSVFTSSPCLSVGFPPPIGAALSYQLWSRLDMIAQPSHCRLPPGPEVLWLLRC